MSEPTKSPLLAPLSVPAFRAIWSANIVSNIGTLMQSVAASWLMMSLTPSTTMVGLVQTASTLPVFLLGLLAGALADIVDRRRLILLSQTWMLFMAGSLTALTMLGWTTPWLLLGLTFGIGVGAAINLPTWQAAVQDIVPKPWIASAVSLNSISFNVARAIGPALGGMIVAAAGAAMAFLLNTISFLATVAAVAWWKPAPRPPQKLAEDVVGAVRSGFRYLLHAPRLQAPILRAMAFNFCAAAVWPLLPLYAREILKTNATGYGLLLAMFGSGSIVSALVIPRLRSTYALDRILAAGTVLCAVAFGVLSLLHHPIAAAVAMFGAGAAWVGVLINFNVAVQTSVPDWVRGRAISFYLLAFQGMLAVDGALWGWLAGRIGIAQCFGVAAIGLLAGLSLIRFLPLAIDETINLGPPKDWPEHPGSLGDDLDDGPVLVTIEFLIDPDRADRFRELMSLIREQRLRDGAHRWRLYQDIENPRRFLELFRLDSWGEHIRQHDRATADDIAVRHEVFALHDGPERPKVTHYLGQMD